VCRLARASLARLGQGEVLELHQVAQPAPHRGVGFLEGLADLPARETSFTLKGKATDAVVSLSERPFQIPQRVGQDLAGQSIGGGVIGERGHDGPASPLPLVLVEEGRDLDEVQEAGVVSPRPHPGRGEGELVRERDHDREGFEEALRIPVPARDLLGLLP
jgi:hypothetical protein